LDFVTLLTVLRVDTFGDDFLRNDPVGDLLVDALGDPPGDALGDLLGDALGDLLGDIPNDDLGDEIGEWESNAENEIDAVRGVFPV
jgi:hypothetical protein